MGTVLAVSSQFNIRPSEVVGLQTDLGKYCFDAACVLYIRYLEDDKVPRFEEDRKLNPGLMTLMG